MTSELEHLRQRAAELEKKCARLEGSLQQSEERFIKIFHASSNMMAITTIKDGRIVNLSEASASLGGYKREELIGCIAAERGLWVDRKQRDAVIEKLKKGERIQNLEVGLYGRNGELHKVLFSADPITMDDEPCMLSVSIDITGREKQADVLRESGEKYRKLVENSLQGLAIIQDSRIVFCNNAFSEISGYSVEELLSMSFDKSTEMIHPDDRAIVLNRFRDRMAGKPVPPRYECRGIKKDGTVIWMEIYSSLIEYNGKPALQAACVDITERKQAENALRESEERFRLIAETIDEFIWIFDMEKQVATYLSPAHKRIWGHLKGCFQDNRKLLFDSIHPDDRERVVDAVALMKTGQALDFEHRLIHSDGSIRHIWNRCFPVPDETGRIKQYIGVGQDVSAWRCAEEALKESKEYLNQIINHIGDLVFVKDRQHRFVLVNDAFCTFDGRPREELLGKSVFELVPKELAISLWERDENVFKTGRESLIEENLTDWQGNCRTLMTKKSLLTDKNGNKHIIYVLRDITEYKRLEAQFLQAQKMEAVGLLAGGVAHDFNNLLNVINGYSELVLEDLAQDNPIRRDIEQIREAGQRAATLTSQLLAFGRKQILQPEIINLNNVITQMSPLLRRLIGEDIEFVSVTQPDLGMVSADPGQIQQIIMNLAVNARDAMPEGGILTIETSNFDLDEDYVREHPAAKAGSHIMLAISDNGIGMDKAIQEHIFEPYFTTKGKTKGTGLGLSTVYGIVKQSNGFIWIYSEPGKGATFKIYFPRAMDKVGKLTGESSYEPGFRGSETVLVAEDETMVRALACRVLRDRGYNVLEAKDGNEALRIAREFAGEIHLILTDVIMPGMNGSAVVSQLEGLRPGIKTLYVSGYTDNAIAHHGTLDSSVAFLQKPFTVDNLARKVRDVLSAQSAAGNTADGLRL